MKPAFAWATFAFCLTSFSTNAQQTNWQQSMEEDRRAAANGSATVLLVRAGSELGAVWPAGVYVFYNNPRPFCYAYVVPGEWYPGSGESLRSKDGRALAGVTFWPPGRLDGVEGATLIERARKVSVRQHERLLRQPLVGVELVPFESARPGTHLLRAAPLTFPNGRTVPFPLNVIVDLSPHTFAEVNVFGTGDDETLARRVIENLRTTSNPECYLADLERMYRASSGGQASVEYLKAEPQKNTLSYGKIVYVDDASCPANEVKEITGGDQRKSIPRMVRCVKRPNQTIAAARAGEVTLTGEWKSLNNQAALYQAQGQYPAAEPLYRRALAIAEKVLGPEHPNVAVSLNNLAALYRVQGRYAAAEPLYKRSLAIMEKAFGPEHPDVAGSLHNLAELYKAQGQYAAAEPLFKRSLAIWEKALGPEHPHVAASLNNLAPLYEAQGRHAAAEPLYKRSLAIREKALGPEHPAVATSLNNLAVHYRDQGRFAAAEPLFTRALAIHEKALGPEHADVATSLNNLATFHQAQGRYAVAVPLHKRSLAIFEKAFGREHPAVAASLNNLAALYQAQGEYAAAEPLYKRALAIAEKALGPEHPDVATSLENISKLYTTMGKADDAKKLADRAAEIRALKR